MVESRRRPARCPGCGLKAGPGLRFCGSCGLDFDKIEAPLAAGPLRDADEPAAHEAPDGHGGGLGSIARFRLRRLARPEHLMNGPALAMIVLGLAGAAGALLAWFTVASTDAGPVSRSGLQMGAFGFLAVAGGLALSVAGVARALHAGSLALAQAVGLVASIALLATFIIEFMAMDSVARGLLGTGSGVAGVGVGLFLVLVSGVAGIAFVGLVSVADS